MARVQTVALDDIEIPGRFLTDGTLGMSDVLRVRQISASTGQPVRIVLDRLGIVSQKLWAETVAAEQGLPVVTLDDFPLRLPKDDRLSVDYMKRNGVALLSVENGRPRIAIANPAARMVLQAVSMVFGEALDLVVATDRDIEAALVRSEAAESKAADPVIAVVTDGDLDTDKLTELANNVPTVRYLDGLFARAVESSATDIHIEMLEKGPRVRLRLDGILVEIDAMDRHLYEGVVSRLKILAGMDISERRLPQDGRIRQKSAGRSIDFRVASAPTVHGETLVLRLLDNKGARAKLDKLNLPATVIGPLRAALSQPNGLILMTGPTGSGKTTTLHAALAELNDVGRKIMTIENPVEIQTPGLIQIEVKADLGWTFASALRTVLRHDPDVLMVGEIRDAETAELAVRAALTGHLVLSTLHTNRAADAVLRLTDMGVPDYLLKSVLRLVGAQRLVRTLCDHCAEPIHDANDQEMELLDGLARLDPSLGPADDWVPCVSVGCAHCNDTGFSGRVAVFEMLDDVASFDAAGGGSGHRTMEMEALGLFARGHTTLPELVRVFGTSAFYT
jgi:type II secretory ATPase GspE/PulE/Tfp pilus assembly ATPase PilB-like protein